MTRLNKEQIHSIGRALKLGCVKVEELAEFGEMLMKHAEAEQEPVALAKRFHEVYERLAPEFGYSTRKETRTFDPESPNGKLMTAVCAEIFTSPPAQAAAVPDGYALVPENESTDEIVTRLYRRFKEWSRRGFTADDVTWCEVKADILSMLNASPAPAEKIDSRNRPADYPSNHAWLSAPAPTERR